MYILLLSIIYLAFISLGLPDSLLGAGWPCMQADFDVPISYMGIISMIISAGTILSSLMSEKLTRKLGTQYVTVLSVFLTAFALFGFSYSAEFWQLCLWAIPYGLGAGAIDATLNNYVALHYSSKHMSWLHCFWGLGAIISPYIMSFALVRSGWQDGYKAVGAIQLAITVILALSVPVWRINKTKKDDVRAVAPIGISGALKIKGVPELVGGFFAYCAAEATIMLWAGSYFFESKSIAEETAAALASLFYIGLTVGRFFGGFLSDKLGDKLMLRTGTDIAIAGMVISLLPYRAISVCGILIAGLGCAPIYPSFIHTVPSRFGAERSQAIIGIQMACAYTGMMLMPSLFGLIANHITIDLLPVFCLAFFAVQAVLVKRI